ncbi:MAG: histidine kinase [Acidobacteria bacterium]|nr:histidine kinase [Acidobacteriota bacterium]
MEAAGKLTIILGYAAGVGKTFRMLVEGHALLDAGRDVVIGYFEPHGRSDTIAKAHGLEMVPRRIVEYRGRRFEEMDTEAIVVRHPQICLVDEFPHTNVPGCARNKRWEDVLVLLDAGIDVITTMNIQHLESLNDQVREMSGVQVRETVPDWVMKRADEMVLVDLTPGALLNRLDRGVVYSRDKAQRAKENFFKEPTLAALREMALRQTAHEVDLRQDGEEPRSREELLRNAAPAEHERILIHVTDSPATVGLIRRARRVADYLRAECFAVAVGHGAGLEAATERHLDFARKLHIETRVLDAEDEAEALVGFAYTNAITQIFLSKPQRSRIPLFAGRRNLVMKVIRAAKDMQVTVVADRHVSRGAEAH